MLRRNSRALRRIFSMKYHTKFIKAAVLSAVCTASSAFAADETVDTVVATVNGTDITLGHVIAARIDLPQEYQALDDVQLFNGILDQIVQQELLKQSVSDIDTTLALKIENETRVIVASSAIEALAANAVTDEALQKAYDVKYANFETGPEFNASHILVETEEEAAALIAELEDGADFAELARTKSTGPSGPNGGNLGWFGIGMMVAPFEAAVTEMDAGDVSIPVQTQFGWHVIKLLETRIPDAPSLDDARGELAEELQQAAVQDGLASLTDGASVERTEGISPASMRNDALLAD
jgi:peptidyl-prolyl cis-trans isomerase C